VSILLGPRRANACRTRPPGVAEGKPVTNQINFITTQSLTNVGGGWSGLSCNLDQHLARSRLLKVHYVGPIEPPIWQRRANMATLV
jgi:hypothetical protein